MDKNRKVRSIVITAVTAAVAGFVYGTFSKVGERYGWPPIERTLAIYLPISAPTTSSIVATSAEAALAPEISRSSDLP